MKLKNLCNLYIERIAILIYKKKLKISYELKD